MQHGCARSAGQLALCATIITLTACGGSSGGGAAAPGDTRGGSAFGNSPPSISGSAPTAVTVGTSYSYTPRATDPDGDPLTFTIQNKPDWASFDPSSGRLSGVAGEGNQGTYRNIEITVSDGELSDSTVFSIEVTQSALGSITLSWQAPTQNEDGTPLTDLAGYVIYYGTQSGDYGHSVEIDNPGIVTYVIENLLPTTYYFASTAVNANGIESDYSNEAVRSVSGT